MIRKRYQDVWVKPHHRVGQVWGHRWKDGKILYTVNLTGEDAHIVHARAKDLLTADKFCDACNKWLPTSSFNGGGQYHNPIDGVVEVEYCFLCTRAELQKGWW